MYSGGTNNLPSSQLGETERHIHKFSSDSYKLSNKVHMIYAIDGLTELFSKVINSLNGNLLRETETYFTKIARMKRTTT